MHQRALRPGLSAPSSPGPEALRAFLRDYYGRVVQKTSDLERKACCADGTAARHKDIVALIPQEVRERNYGCGCSIPDDDLRGLTVLDLGSGAGLDAFIAARLVGPEGHVHGLDMTEEQLAVARRNLEPAMAAFGFARPNVTFHQGYIETADPIPSGSIDLVISDCTINLSPLKDEVLRSVHRVLRTGGELYVSDIVADRRVPESLQHDRTLVAECLGGALYEHDWLDLLREHGFGDPRVVARSVVDEDIGGVPIRFSSLTVRAFKAEPALDRRCEDYGQTATYLGSIAAAPARWALDEFHVFEARRPLAVCRNTARLLCETRLGRHFRVSEPITHFGLFPCGPAPAPAADPARRAGPCC